MTEQQFPPTHPEYATHGGLTGERGRELGAGE
jgi:hypothetical protein